MIFMFSGEDYACVCLCMKVRGHIQVSFLGGYIPCFLRLGGLLDWNATLRLAASRESPRDLAESILPVLRVQTHATAILFRVTTEDRMPIDPGDLKVTNNHFCSEAVHRKREKRELFPWISALTGSCICLYLKEPEKKIFNCFLKQML